MILEKVEMVSPVCVHTIIEYILWTATYCTVMLYIVV